MVVVNYLCSRLPGWRGRVSGPAPRPGGRPPAVSGSRRSGHTRDARQFAASIGISATSRQKRPGSETRTHGGSCQPPPPNRSLPNRPAAAAITCFACFPGVMRKARKALIDRLGASLAHQSQGPLINAGKKKIQQPSLFRTGTRLPRVRAYCLRHTAVRNQAKLRLAGLRPPTAVPRAWRDVP